MKASNLLSTVGNRDVQLDRNAIQSLGCEVSTDSDHNIARLTFSDISLDLKADKNFPNVWFILNPRAGGKTILENFEFFQAAILLPLFEPAYQYCLKNEGSNGLHLITLVVTDQPDGEKMRKSDTLFFGQIIEKWVENQWKDNSIDAPSIEYIPIKESVTDITALYRYFRVNHGLIKEFEDRGVTSDERKIYLFNQGGIDAINSSLLLAVIELFPDAIQIQKAKEDQNSIIKSNFPAEFRNNLARKNLITMAKRFDFSGILENTFTGDTKFLADFGKHLKTSNGTAMQSLAKSNKKVFHESIWIEYSQFASSNSVLSFALMAAQNAIIAFETEDYVELLIRIATLPEVLYIPVIEKFGGFKIDVKKYFFDRMQMNQLSVLYQTHPEVMKKSKLYEFRNDNNYLPKHFQLKDLSNLLSNNHPINQLINQVYNNFEILRDMRNGLVHLGYGFSTLQIRSSLETANLTKEKLTNTLNQYFEFFDIPKEYLQIPYLLRDKIVLNES